MRRANLILNLKRPKQQDFEIGCAFVNANYLCILVSKFCRNHDSFVNIAFRCTRSVA